MQDNQKKYRKKYAVMTVFFLISASFLFGCGNKDSAVPETEEFLFSAEEEKSDHTSQKSEEPAEKAERKKAEADSGTVEIISPMPSSRKASVSSPRSGHKRSPAISGHSRSS